jgi:predicted ATPase
VGRASELAALHTRLEDPACRLVTLLGLGGSGKTRLALAAAARYVQTSAADPSRREHPHFPDGVFLVELGALNREVAPDADAAHVLGQRLVLAIGQTLGVDFATAADPLSAVGRCLERKRLLLVLDNAEGLADGTLVVNRLVRQAPGLTVLATSRERLRLPGEWVLDVEGLARPGGPADLEQAPASQLFLAQAQRVGAGGPLTAEERAEIVRICRLTQGLPLALILAAHWRTTLSYAAIATQLERGMDLPNTCDPLVPGWQRSMHTVLAATWARLAPEEQAALRQLTVCRGGCTLEAARAVTGATPGTLLALCDGALLALDAEGRYAMHELVRQFAVEQAATQPVEATAAAGRHARHFAALVERTQEELWRTPQATTVIAVDLANIQTTWKWAVAQGAWDLLAQMRAGLSEWHYAAMLHPHWAAQVETAVEQLRAALATGTGHEEDARRLLGALLIDEVSMRIVALQLDQGVALLDEAATLSESLPAEAAQALQADIAYWRGRTGILLRDVAAAQRDSERALALARTVRAQHMEAHSLFHLGRVALLRNDAAAAQPYLEQAQALFRTLRDRQDEAWVNLYLGMSAFERGQTREALLCLNLALDFSQIFGARGIQCRTLMGLGLVYDQGLGRHREAETYFTQGLAILQEAVFRPDDESLLLAYLGRSALAQGDQERTWHLLSWALHTGDGPSAMDGHARALLGLGWLAHDQGDEHEAHSLAEQALALAQESWQPRVERSALRLLGHILATWGRLEQATLAYTQALEIGRGLGYRYLAIDSTADLARVALSAGDLPQAMAYAATALDYLAERAPDWLEEPIRIFLTCYEALRATSDRRADEVLDLGHALLLERAAQFDDEERRRRYLENVPAHRALLAAWEDRRSRHASVGGHPTPAPDEAHPSPRGARPRSSAPLMDHDT